RRARRAEPSAVVLDGQQQAVLPDARTNVDLGRVTVLDGVRDRLLRDAIEVVRALLAQVLVEARRRLDPAFDAEDRLRPLRELLERMTERRARLARHRAQSPRELRRLRNRLIDQIDRLLQVAGVAVAGGRQL